jgi:hypothetical protein
MTDKELALIVGGSISYSPTRPHGESVGAMKPLAVRKSSPPRRSNSSQVSSCQAALGQQEIEQAPS